LFKLIYICNIYKNIHTMAIPSRQIGWGTEENLLWQISKQLEYLSGITYNSGGGVTPTPTPAASPTLTYTNIGTLDSMAVNFKVTVPTANTQNPSGTKTVQSYYSPDIAIDNYSGSNSALTSIVFPDVISVYSITVKYIDSLTSISFPQSIYFSSIDLQDLYFLTTFNTPFLSGFIDNIRLEHIPLLANFNSSDIVIIEQALSINDCGMTSINFDSLQYINGRFSSGTAVYIRNCSNLTTVNIPDLVNNYSGAFQIYDNPNLTSITIGTIGTLKYFNDTVDFSNNALSETSVNSILALLVSLDDTGGTSTFYGNVDLSGGTNAAPTGQGLVDKATLEARGCTVTTN